MREFLYSDDMADACVFLLENYEGEQHVNIGTGEEISIKELAMQIKKMIGYEGDLIFDTTKPDGVPRKVTDVSKVHTLGWIHKISLEEGIARVYKWFLENSIDESEGYRKVALK